MDKRIIGRKDRIDFPELILIDIDVKIDTGAYTSSIHCHNIELIDNDDILKVRFNLLDPSHPDHNEKEFILPVYKHKQVRSSSGEAEKRIFIITKALIFDQLIDVELSLTDRSDMKFPVLLGRKVLRKRFIVDVMKRDLSFIQKHKTQISYKQKRQK